MRCILSATIPWAQYRPVAVIRGNPMCSPIGMCSPFLIGRVPTSLFCDSVILLTRAGMSSRVWRTSVYDAGRPVTSMDEKGRGR